MFGTLKPTLGGLGCAARKDWQHFYCGTCQSLGAHFGHGYRGLLSHDAVFLALLVDGLGIAAAGPSRTRCPMLPIVHRPTISPDSVAMRYAASIQLLLADQWLADRAVDGGTLARAARPLIERRTDHARATLRELGSDLDALIGFEQVQAEVEQRGRTSPEHAAEPTAAALELVFDGIARLPGLPRALPSPGGTASSPAPSQQASCELELAEQLGRLGRRVGQAIYVIDALEDLDDDLRSGDFNPCVELDRRGRARIHHGRLRQAEALLELATDEIAALLAALPLIRHRLVLRSILVDELGGRARLARAAATRAVERDGERLHLLARLSEATGVLRFAQALFALVFAIATTTWSRIARAATETGGTETGGTETGGTETGTGTGETGGELGLDDVVNIPDLPTDGGGGGPSGNSAPPCFDDCIQELCASLCGGLGQACGEMGGCGQACGGACSDCGQVCGDGMSDCSGGCLQGCGNECGNICGTCNGCEQGCGQGCNGCGQACGDGCSGCDQGCNGCGQGCSGCAQGCDGCGQGCSGCGQGCNGCGQGCNGCGNSGCNGC